METNNKKIKKLMGFLQIASKKYPIYEGLNTIGRNPKAKVNIKNINVSQNHAIITVVDEDLQYISDLGSSNYTYIESTQLEPLRLYQLKNGSNIGLADVIAQYEKVTVATNPISLDTIEATQNPTQGFYGAATQIVEEDENPHSYSKKPDENMLDFSTQLRDELLTELSTQDFRGNIHEMATQAIPIEQDSRTNIHELETQAILKQDSRTNIHEMETQAIIKQGSRTNIHELETQAIIKQDSRTNIHNLPTQFINVDNIGNDTNKEEDNSRRQSVDDSLDSVICVQNEPVEVINLDTQPAFASSSESDDRFPNDLSTQALLAVMESYESDQSQTKSDSTNLTNEKSQKSIKGNEGTIDKRVSIEDSICDEKSNDSIDLFTMQKATTQHLTEEPQPSTSKAFPEESGRRSKYMISDSDDSDLDDEIIAPKRNSNTQIKNSAKKLSSDSETDDEALINSEENKEKDIISESGSDTDDEIVTKKKTPRVIPTSESPTDDEIVTKKKPLRRLLSSPPSPEQKKDSDNDGTILEEKSPVKDTLPNNNENECNSNSDDDIFTPMRNNKKPQAENPNVSDLVNGSLNETDIIPSTQLEKDTSIRHVEDFLKPKDKEPVKEPVSDQIDDDLVYQQSTQRINGEETDAAREVDEIYLQSTQQINQDSRVQNDEDTGLSRGEEELEDSAFGEGLEKSISPVCTNPTINNQKDSAQNSTSSPETVENLESTEDLFKQPIRTYSRKTPQSKNQEENKDDSDDDVEAQLAMMFTSQKIKYNEDDLVHILEESPSYVPRSSKRIQERNENKENKRIKGTALNFDEAGASDDSEDVEDQNEQQKAKANKVEEAPKVIATRSSSRASSQSSVKSLNDEEEKDKGRKTPKKLGQNKIDDENKSKRETRSSNVKTTDKEKEPKSSKSDEKEAIEATPQTSKNIIETTTEINKKKSLKPVGENKGKKEIITLNDIKLKKVEEKNTRTSSRITKVYDLDAIASTSRASTLNKSSNETEISTRSGRSRSSKSKTESENSKTEINKRAPKVIVKRVLQVESVAEDTVEDNIIKEINQSINELKNKTRTTKKTAPAITEVKLRATKKRRNSAISDESDKEVTHKRANKTIGFVAPSTSRVPKAKSIADDKNERRSKRLTKPSSKETESDDLEPVKMRRLSANSRSMKNRKATDSSGDELTPPSTPKKRKTFAAPPSASSTSTKRKISLDSSVCTPDRSRRKLKPKVVFTMLDNPELESWIRTLGGSVVDTVDSSTVLLTEHVKRSQKLLTAVGQGKPICPPEWILESRKAGTLLDPWDFILVDKEAEKNWSFSLEESLTRSQQRRLLEGYVFQIFVNTAAEVLKAAIEACGGKCVTRNLAKSAGDHLVIVSTRDSKSKFEKIVKQHPHIKVVEPEAIFDGVLRQELRLERHLVT